MHCSAATKAARSHTHGTSPCGGASNQSRSLARGTTESTGRPRNAASLRQNCRQADHRVGGIDKLERRLVAAH